MKITIESDDGTMVATVQQRGVEEYYAVVDLFKQVSCGYGFAPETVSDYFDIEEPILGEEIRELGR
jgi:hypothetical protein